MAAPRPGNDERGWNDPPMFDYHSGGGVGTGSPQHTKLNKRVAYPMAPDAQLPAGTATLLNPSDGPPRLPPVHILPPTSTTVTPTPLPVLVPSLSPILDPCGDSPLSPAIFSPTTTTVPGLARPVHPTSSAAAKVKDLPTLLADLSLESEAALLEYVKAGLISASESVKEELKGRAMEDVKKKVTLMGEWWTSGKLSAPVQCLLASLVEALNRNQVEEAHELHLSLMVNHTTEVNQWMVGVKRIIQELRAKTPADPASSSQSTPLDSILLNPPTLGLTDSADTQSPLESDAQSSAQSPQESEEQSPQESAESTLSTDTTQSPQAGGS